jgi:hypothetical protein
MKPPTGTEIVCTLGDPIASGPRAASTYLAPQHLASRRSTRLLPGAPTPTPKSEHAA